MKIVDTLTETVLAEILTNQSWDIDAACDFADVKLMRTEEDFANENGYDYEHIRLDA